MCGQFPETWDSIPLDHLAVYVLGGDWGKNADYDDPDYVRVRCIRASELRDWKSNHGSTAALRKIKKSSLARRQLRDGDIVVEVSGGGPEQPVGRTELINSIVLAKNPRYPKICTNFFRLLRPAREMNSSFLDHYLKFFYKTGKIASYQGGSNNLRNLKFNDYLTLRVLVPPAREQRRIVAKIEELFSELDKGVESLKTAREQLKVYRQAVLKHAFEGKLTAQWREENKDKLETAERLLAHIGRERDALYEQQLKDWKVAIKKWEEKGRQGKKSPKPRKFRAPENLRSDEKDGLPSLPGNWRLVRLCQIAQIGTGMSVSATRTLENPLDVPYLRVANVQRGFLDLSTVKTMTIEKSQLDRLQLKKWDVLFNEGGDRDKLGRGWIWQSQIAPCITQNHVFRASPFMASEFNSKIVSYWANAFGQQYFEKKGKQTTNLASINKTVLSHFPVPLIPREEQEELCKQIDKFMTILDAQEQEIASAFRLAGLLRQSILKEAFSGELVEQDPNDEPAAVLLKRIKTEKESRKPKAKTPKRKVANA